MADRRGRFRSGGVERMLRGPDVMRTTPGSRAPGRRALLEIELRKVEDLAR
ncbi:hypothetical protein ACI79C_03420 [Geodermatophilus sp. SYSU D00697]